MSKHYGKLVWLIVTLFVVYSFCLNTASAVFSNSIQSSLHANNIEVSLATGAFILGFALMQIPAGYLLDKFNARYIVSAGVLLLSIGNVLISLSTTLLLYALSNFIQGIGASFAFVAAAVLIAQWFPPARFPILFGLTQAISCISAAIIHYYFTIALAAHSWNTLYQGLAIVGFILFILTLLLVKSPPEFKQETNLTLRESLSLVLRNRQIWLCSIAAATSFGVLLAYAGFWFTKVQAFYQVSQLQAVIIGGMIFFGIGVGTPLFGWISNQVNSRIAVIHVTLCLGTMALLMGIYLPHYALNTLLIAKITAFFTGFFLSGSMLFYTLVSENSSSATRGLAISVLNTAVFLFNAFMLFIPYWFLTTFSIDFFTYLWILPFLIIFSILLLYFIKESLNSR